MKVCYASIPPGVNLTPAETAETACGIHQISGWVDLGAGMGVVVKRKNIYHSMESNAVSNSNISLPTLEDEKSRF
jgi:hypothetical protein